MSEHRSSRNQTITLTDLEATILESKLLTPRDRLSISSIMDKTILGDSLQVIDELPLYFVDLLFVDPPYNMNKVFGCASFREMGAEDYESWVRTWVLKVLDRLKPNASVYVCGDWKSSSALFRVLSRYLTVRNRITWEREKGRGAKFNWKNSSEDIWFATVGEDFYFNVEAVKLKKKVIAPYRDQNGLPKDWVDEDKGRFRLTHPSNLWTDISVPFWSMAENTDHPTQKPEKLVAKAVLASSRPGDVVMDPFLGSGTTSVVAKKLGRRYVGIEIDKHYACIAEKRLEMAETDNRVQGYAEGAFWERNTSREGRNHSGAIAQKRLPL